jgi:hypothetical protein
VPKRSKSMGHAQKLKSKRCPRSKSIGHAQKLKSKDAKLMSVIIEEMDLRNNCRVLNRGDNIESVAFKDNMI